MGGVDKGLINLAGKPLIEHVIARLTLQVSGLVISANRNLKRYRHLGYPVVQDESEDYLGPLAGMASAMNLAKTPYILTVPCDCPFFPADLAVRIITSLQNSNAQLCVAHDGKNIQPVFALISCALMADIQTCLESGQRKVEAWLTAHAPAFADFSGQPMAFANINTEQDLILSEQRIRLAHSC